MSYYIACQDERGNRFYLDSNGNFNKNLYRNKNSGTLKFADLDAALMEAELFDALVLTEGEDGLVTI